MDNKDFAITNKAENAVGFTFSFTSSQSPKTVFETLLNVRGWWSGLFGEHIEGDSSQLNDEFTFKAGEGMHYSRQKLIELVPEQNIAWQVTDSNLTFLQKTDEWTGTTIRFDLSAQGKGTEVTFTHTGLLPAIECYKECAGAWTKYMEQLAQKLG